MLDQCDTDEDRLEMLGQVLTGQLQYTEELLRCFGRAITQHVQLTRAMEEQRDTLARSLYDAGRPITRIAQLARLTDSHMGRRIRRSRRRQPRGRHGHP
jgi:hypothetical protein